jgi:hypothetical protein
MSDNSSAAPGMTARLDAINWTAAVFGAAVLGGITYGILARAFQIGEPVEGGVAGWLPAGIVSIGMLLVGLGLLRAVRTSGLRTAAAALAAAPATGGLIVLEIFIAWAVSQLV